MKKRQLLPVCLFALASSSIAALPSSEPCIPDGDSKTYCWEAVDEGDGITGNFTIVPGSISGFAKDASGSADLGDGSTQSGDSDLVCITLSNSGGTLSGPNADAAPADSDGCVDVYVTYTVTYRELVHTVDENGNPIQYYVSRTKTLTKKDESKTVCPC